jgi:hypothetical protein
MRSLRIVRQLVKSAHPQAAPLAHLAAVAARQSSHDVLREHMREPAALARQVPLVVFFWRHLA